MFWIYFKYPKILGKKFEKKIVSLQYKVTLLKNDTDFLCIFLVRQEDIENQKILRKHAFMMTSDSRLSIYFTS